MGALKQMFIDASRFTNKYKFGSFAIIFATVYVASYQFGDPHVPTAKQRMEKIKKKEE